jgi:hypothetical protein
MDIKIFNNNDYNDYIVVINIIISKSIPIITIP